MENYQNFHTCKICPYRTNSDIILNKHLKLHKTRSKIAAQACESEQIEPHECPYCHYQTNLKTEILYHITSTHFQEHRLKPPKTRKLRCGSCRFKTYSALVLLGHACTKPKPVALFHKEEIFCEIRNMNLHTCDHCDYITKYKSSLKSHVISKHTEYDDIKWFKCGQCAYQAKQRGNLNAHMLSKHIDWFACDQCGFKTKKKSELNAHKRAKHKAATVVKWLKCEQCLFVTKSKYYLKRHMWSKHNSGGNVKWFRCEQCAYKSKYLGNLKNHVISKHTQSVINTSAVVNC